MLFDVILVGLGLSTTILSKLNSIQGCLFLGLLTKKMIVEASSIKTMIVNVNFEVEKSYGTWQCKVLDIFY